MAEPEPGPGPLQLSLKHAAAVFGTDFDVVVEVGRLQVEAWRRFCGWCLTSPDLCAGEEPPGHQRRRPADGPGQGRDLHRSGPRGVPQTESQRGRAGSLRLAEFGTFRTFRCLLILMVGPAHKEVLHLRYHDYADWASEHHLIRVEAFLNPTGHGPIMRVVNIPLSTPELLVQVSPQVLAGPRSGRGRGQGVHAPSQQNFCPSSRFLEKLSGGKTSQPTCPSATLSQCL